jgi:hypothetical protein
VIREKDYFCQFNSYSNKRLAQAACGITSIAMILSAERKLPKENRDKKNLDWLLIYINSLQKNNVDCVKRKFKLSELDIWITLGFADQVNELPGDLISNDYELFPAFILFRGYDHRASHKIFKNFGLEANILEKTDSLDIYNKISQKRVKYFLASIKTDFKDKDSLITPSHIVVIHKAIESENGSKYIEYIDPAYENVGTARNKMTLEEFENKFNNFGTAVI